MLAAGLFLQINSAAQTANNNEKNDELPPELKQTAEKLLGEIVQENGRLYVAENRIRAGATVAELLWEKDEQTARAVFQNALGELQNMSVAINPPNGLDEMSRAEKSAHFSQRYAFAKLRREFLLALVGRDANAAFTALDTLRIKTVDEYDPLEPNELELELAAIAARKSSDKSYEVTKNLLDANGLNYQFVKALNNLHKQDSELAARLAGDALDLVKKLKINVPSSAVNAPTTPPDPNKEIDFWRLLHFITTAAEINRTAERDKEKKIQPIFNQAEMKELVEIIANAFLAAIQPNPTSISQVMPEIVAHSPAMAQRIRQKVGAENSKQLDRIVESHSFYKMINENSVDELVKEAERSAPDVRDQRFSSAAYKALEEGDAEKAQMVAERIKERKKHVHLFGVIKDALPLSKARRGDAAEVDKFLATVKTDYDKVRILTELARAAAVKGDLETAKTMLDQRLGLVSGNPGNYQELESVVRVASVYSIVAPEQAFTMLENAAAQIDQYIAAGIKLDEFYIGSSTKSDELLFTTINRNFLLHVPNATDLIKNLARADLERTIAFADKFQRPEIRQFVRLRVAASVLDEGAAEKEKKMRNQIVGDQDH